MAADVEIREHLRVHALSCPTDLGQLQKLINGLITQSKEAGRPIEYDDDVIVTVEDSAIVLTRVGGPGA